MSTEWGEKLGALCTEQTEGGLGQICYYSLVK